MKRLYALAIGLALIVGMIAVPVFGDDHYLSDDDEDSLPWIAEVLLCNNGAIRLAVNTVGQTTGAGECSDPEDFQGEDTPDPGPIPPEEPQGPDALLCSVVNQSALLGSCDDENNYTPPPAPGADPNAVLCSVVNESELLGSCDDENNYTPPPTPGADPKAVLCSVVNQSEELGSCDDENNYTPPPTPGVDPKAALCSVVNETPELGSCDDENNYSPPPVPDGTPSHHQLMCGDEPGDGLENAGTGLDGSCQYGEEGPTYSPPPVPSPPEDPPAGPGDLGCGGAESYPQLVDQLLTDADCDGWTNEEELFAGCNPLDDSQSPADPAGCQDVGDPPQGHCSGYGADDPVRLLNAILADADCDGWTNEEELDRGTNPLVPDA